MPKALVIPDTNLFLHYRSLEQIDWLQLLKVDQVEIVIAQVLIRELNQKKDFGDTKKIRTRAASALKNIAKYALQDNPPELRHDVILSARRDEPLIDFEKERLNRNVEDDWFVATMLELRSEFDEAEIILVSRDIGLQLKVKGRGFKFASLPDDLLLPEEPDPDKKRIDELNKELAFYKNRLPELELTFENGLNRIQVELERVALVSEDELASQMAKFRVAHPKAAGPSQYSPGDLGLRAIGPADIDRHNLRVEKFWRDYEDYVKEMDEFCGRKSRSFDLLMILLNAGSAKAADIDIFIHFPDGMLVSDKGFTFPEPKEPTAPSGPKSAWEEQTEMLANVAKASFADNIIANFDSAKASRTLEAIGRNVGELSVKKTNSYEVRGHVGELKHYMQVRIGSVNVSFDSWNVTKPFKVEYEILAADLPAPVTGELHVIPKIISKLR